MKGLGRPSRGAGLADLAAPRDALQDLPTSHLPPPGDSSRGLPTSQRQAVFRHGIPLPSSRWATGALSTRATALEASPGRTTRATALEAPSGLSMQGTLEVTSARPVKSSACPDDEGLLGKLSSGCSDLECCRLEISSLTAPNGSTASPPDAARLSPAGRVTRAVVSKDKVILHELSSDTGLVAQRPVLSGFPSSKTLSRVDKLDTLSQRWEEDPDAEVHASIQHLLKLRRSQMHGDVPVIMPPLTEMLMMHMRAQQKKASRTEETFLAHNSVRRCAAAVSPVVREPEVDPEPELPEFPIQHNETQPVTVVKC